MRLLIAFISNAGLQLTLLYVAVLTALSGNTAGLTVALLNRAAKQIAAGRLLFRDALWFALALAGFLVIKRLALRQTIRLSESVVEQYRLNVAHLIRQAELLDIEQVGEQDIYLKLTNDAQKVAQAIRKSLKGFEAVVIAVFAFGYMIWLASGAAFAALAFNGLAVVVFLVARETLHPLTHTVADRETDLFGLVAHLLDGFKELKIDQAKNDDLVQQYLRMAANTVKALRIRLSGLFAELEITFDALYYLGIGSILFLFTDDVSAATRFEVVAMTLFLWTRLYRIYLAVPYITAAEVSVERLEQLAAQLQRGGAPLSPGDNPTSAPGVAFRELRFEHLVFHYRDHEGKPTYTLGPLTLALQPGELVYLCGGNGSGKTTLVKLLTGLYQPFSGVITLDAAAIGMATHRDLCAPIFSDAHLFDSLYGLTALDDQRVNDLLRLMELDRKTQWHGRRFTDLNLSTGQRKRVALIQALLEEKPLYIFDEWAAEQDPYFRAYFYEELLPALKAQQKAVLVVTHDERYFHLADRIVQLQDGKIIPRHAGGQTQPA